MHRQQPVGQIGSPDACSVDAGGVLVRPPLLPIASFQSLLAASAMLNLHNHAETLPKRLCVCLAISHACQAETNELASPPSWWCDHMRGACAKQRAGTGRCVRCAVGAGHVAAWLEGLLGSPTAGRWCGCGHRWRGAACRGSRSCKGGCMLSTQAACAVRLAASHSDWERQ